MLLNKNYYLELWLKYQQVFTLPTEFTDNSTLLTLRIILDSIKHENSIHINYQGVDNTLLNIELHLFVELANKIFCHSVDYPNIKLNDKIKSKAKIGIINPKNLIFSINSIKDNKYVLKCNHPKHDTLTYYKTYEEIIEGFIPIKQNVRDNTLNRFYQYFNKLNQKTIHDFFPTDFTKKSVFVSSKYLWTKLDVKNKIPCAYLPSHREDGEISEIYSIPALIDCIMYVTPKYNTCYEKILMKGKKIDTIVICDTEIDQIQQILQDRNKYGFKLIVLTNSIKPGRISGIPLWNWFKEEIDMVNSL